MQRRANSSVSCTVSSGMCTSYCGGTGGGAGRQRKKHARQAVCRRHRCRPAALPQQASGALRSIPGQHAILCSQHSTQSDLVHKCGGALQVECGGVAPVVAHLQVGRWQMVNDQLGLDGIYKKGVMPANSAVGNEQSTGMSRTETGRR